MSIIPHRNLIILCILFAAPLRVDPLSSAEPIPEVAMHQIGEDIPTPAAFERAQVVIVARVERVGEAQLGPPGSTRIAGTQVKTLMSFKGGALPVYVIGYNLQTFPPERAQRAPGVGDQVILFLDEVTPNPQSRTAIKTLQASAQAADELVALALKASQDK